MLTGLSQWPRFLTLFGLGAPVLAVLLAALFGDGTIDIDNDEVPSYQNLIEFNLVGFFIAGFFVFLNYLVGEVMTVSGAFLRKVMFRNKKEKTTFAQAVWCKSEIVERELFETKRFVELFDGAGSVCIFLAIAWPLSVPGGSPLAEHIIGAAIFLCVGIAFFATGSRRADLFADRLDAVIENSPR